MMHRERAAGRSKNSGVHSIRVAVPISVLASLPALGPLYLGRAGEEKDKVEEEVDRVGRQGVGEGKRMGYQAESEEKFTQTD